VLGVLGCTLGILGRGPPHRVLIHGEAPLELLLVLGVLACTLGILGRGPPHRVLVSGEAPLELLLVLGVLGCTLGILGREPRTVPSSMERRLSSLFSCWES